MFDFHAALIAGTHSGVGKTTWSLVLMAYFRQKGLEVQPFKVGPDYIDPGFHHRICHPRKSRNLDRFFLSESYLKDCFNRHTANADLALVEGVMGLYDGRGAHSEEGSTAEMAKLLGLPVFLVMDGAGLARSAAAVVQGYKNFDSALNLRGVFTNRVGSEGHFRLLREAIEKETGVPVLGWLPQDASVSIPERHLGLRTASEEDSLEKKIEGLVKLLESRFDFGRFLELSRREGRPKTHGGENSEAPSKMACRIGVAYDQAFSFYYEDNFDLLRQAGAEIVFFSPLEDTKIPLAVDALYLGGGFPELHAESLGRNESMKDSIRNFYREGGMIYGECGGLIYLVELGLIPGKIHMRDRLQNFGYHEMESAMETFLCPEWKKLKSHEFHYSSWEAESKDFAKPYRLQGRSEGFYDGRILASYQHLHFGQDPELASNLVRAAQANKRKNKGTKIVQSFV